MCSKKVENKQQSALNEAVVVYILLMINNHWVRKLGRQEKDDCIFEGENTFSATCIFNMVWMAFLIHFGHLGNVTKNNKCFPSLFTIYVVSCYWVPMLTFISAVCIPEILFCDGPGLRPDVGQHGDGQLEILLGRKKLERAGRHGLVARHGHQQQLHRGRGPKPISGKSQVCGWLWALKESQKTTTKKKFA